MKVYALLLCLYGYYFYSARAAISTAIPGLLRDCYRSNYTTISPKPPLTIQLLVELIRKIELNETNSLSMRLLTTSMLSAVRFDGIQWSPSSIESEVIIPYRASGNQFPSYALLVRYLTPGEASLFPSDSLKMSEVCLLHELISSTIDPWERGDERVTCRTVLMPTNQNEHRNGRQQSACPQEHGVAKSRWGSVSPGRIIAGTASALQQTQDTLQNFLAVVQPNTSSIDHSNSKYSTAVLDNVWLSTVVNDLAEMIIYQASENPEIGNVGYWNDTLFPRAYLTSGANFELTQPELLGGIDGAVIASKIKEWTNVLSSTRLSQIVDMYYSNRGIGYNSTYKSCNRFLLYADLLESVELHEQVFGATQLLQQFGQPDRYLNDADIGILTQAAVKSYKEAVDRTALQYECENATNSVPPTQIIAVLDSFWDNYSTKQLLSTLIEEADISYYGSKIGIMSGQSGTWLTNVTGDIVQLFEDIDRANNTWPSSLSLTRSFEQIIFYYQDNIQMDCKSTKIKPNRQVVVVLAPWSRITDSDWNRISLAIDGIKSLNPATSIIYVTSESNAANYDKLANLYADDHHLISNSSIDSMVKSITDRLEDKPGNIVNFFCNGSEAYLEDYVTPNVTTFYEIRASQIERARITVEFKGNDYGDLTICAYERNWKANEDCKNVTGSQQVDFGVDHYCQNATCNVIFSVLAGSTKFKCSEADCRYPDQARLDIHTSWRSGSLTPTLSIPTLVALVIPNIILVY